MEASTRVIPLLHHYPVSTEPDEMWEHGNVMLGFDAEERLIQKLPNDFAAKVVWGSRYPHHDATSAWDAMAKLRKSNVPEPLIARMMGQNAADQFGAELMRQRTAVGERRGYRAILYSKCRELAYSSGGCPPNQFARHRSMMAYSRSSSDNSPLL